MHVGSQRECRVICDTDREQNKGQITLGTININYGANVSEHAAFYALSAKRGKKHCGDMSPAPTTAECH